jgi:pimeloyl-ACP methyl ester carboxylesterase
VFLDINNRKVFSLSFGAAPRTFLAHGGWVGDSELWLQPLEILSQSWRAVTYDHRGTGLTTSVPDDITHQGLVDDVFAVMDALKIETCVLAGESSGVLVVLDAYFTHPDRFDGLVLVDGNPGSSDGPRDDESLIPMRLDFPAYWQTFVDRCIPEAGADHIRRWGRRIGARSDSEHAARLAGAFEGIAFGDRLAEVAVQTLVIHGSDDKIVPLEGGRVLAEGIPNSKLVIIDGAGHVPTLTFPFQVADAINVFFAPQPT